MATYKQQLAETGQATCPKHGTHDNWYYKTSYGQPSVYCGFCKKEDRARLKERRSLGIPVKTETVVDAFFRTKISNCKTHGDHADFVAVATKSRCAKDGRLVHHLQCRKCRRNRATLRLVKNPIGSLLSSVITGAKNRNLEYALNAEIVSSIYSKQNGLCALTGIPICFSNKTCSIDRVDSSKGYVPDNVWIVHKNVNVMKMDLSMSEFVEYCQAVVKTHGSI